VGEAPCHGFGCEPSQLGVDPRLDQQLQIFPPGLDRRPNRALHALLKGTLRGGSHEEILAR
jgi:hypothetical protein